ncbi:MAG: DUF6431 domain-containing protein [Clostridiales bacterium]|nr:DUF6431 domain-containing protein [Clostridiales bacterium]
MYELAKVGVTVCPYCGGVLEHYDTVQRTALGKRRVKKTLYIDRDRCQRCGRYHREIPDTIYPSIHISSGFSGAKTNTVTKKRTNGRSQ